MFLSTQFWGIALPALSALVVWWLNERSKRAWEEYRRKEESYRELLRCLRGFYAATADRALKEAFLTQVNLLWIYAPDDVIEAAYAFLETVKTGSPHAGEKNGRFAKLIETIRKDALSRRPVSKTKLSGGQFQHFSAN